MTAAQAIRGRRNAKLDPRYANKGKKSAEASNKRLAKAMEKQKAINSRKGNKK